MKMNVPKMGGDIEITINVCCGEQEDEKEEEDDSPEMIKAPKSLAGGVLRFPESDGLNSYQSQRAPGRNRNHILDMIGV